MVTGLRIVVLTVCAVLMAGCGGGSARPASGRPASEAPAGREIFFTQCYGCHTLGAAGTPIAPDLSRIGARLSRDEIERRLRDPRTHKPTARMPKLDLDAAEIDALATYLSELR
jgi:mono/diheme cytochrome c family protein